VLRREEEIDNNAFYGLGLEQQIERWGKLMPSPMTFSSKPTRY
jgi:hypothetical protein